MMLNPEMIHRSLVKNFSQQQVSKADNDQNQENKNNFKAETSVHLNKKISICIPIQPFVLFTALNPPHSICESL